MSGKKENPHVHNVVMGHVGSGKSTLVGHMMCKCQGISREVFAEFAKLAQEMGKGINIVFFKYFWLISRQRNDNMNPLT